jgi:FKBP-type peptidyl-prolyl cis-trans isomerase
MVNISFAEEDAVLKNEKDRLSYAIGMDIGNGLKRQNIDLNHEIVAQGIWDALSGGKTLLTEQEYRDTMTAFKQEMSKKQMAQMQEFSEKNQKADYNIKSFRQEQTRRRSPVIQWRYITKAH